MQEQILKSINSDPEEQHRLDLAVFLQEFTQRRTDLNYNIFPQTFLKWLELDNVV
jgi:hypothetical protein